MTRSAPRFRIGLLILCTLVATSRLALGQGSSATIRGSVQDPTGAVLPGATVSVTNTGTKTVQSTVTDDRGSYLLAGLFPGTYDLKVELSGFKTYERTSVALSPNDNRGIDVRLELGQQSELVTVTGVQEVIQTETGAREGVLTRQTDREPVDHRPQLARVDAHPAGSSHRVQRRRIGGLRHRRQQHAGLHRQRHPLVWQHGLTRRIVTPRHRQQRRRHRVAQQRHGAGSQGPEREFRRRVRHGRHEHQRRDQVGHVAVPWFGLQLLARLSLRGQRSLQQHHAHAQAQEHLPVSRRQRRRPDLFRRRLHEEQRPAVLLRGVRGAAPASRLRIPVHPDPFSRP